MEEVVHFLINELGLKNGDCIIIGVSGGPDSMALLNLISQLRNKIKLTIICAHVNHKIRKESDQEQEFVSSYCKQHNIIFEGMQITDYTDDNFHKQARDKRYHFFEKLLCDYHANYLFTAHHGDDLMETILMRIVRGSTLKGYAGFPRVMKRKNYWLVRPFIHLTKEEIFSYLKVQHLTWADDSSNQKDIYTRNRYRKYIVSQLKQEDPTVHHKFYKFSSLLLENDAYVYRQSQEELKKVYQDGILDLDLFLRLEHIIQKNILNIILESFYQNHLSLISDKHLDIIEQIIKSEKPNLMIDLPNNLKIEKSYHILYFINNTNGTNKNDTYLYEFHKQQILPNGKMIYQVTDENNNSNDVCRLDYSEIVLPLVIRTKKPGDVIEVKGLNGHKKIKDIFIDEKIPIRDRKSWPIVTDSTNTIVWLPGIKKSKFDKQNEEKYDIILKYN